MELSSGKRNIVLGILFFLPVAFIVIMMLSKENYNTLDIVNANVKELPENPNDIKLNGHITVLSFLGKHPMQNATAALNLKEILYDWSKGFKKFQVVVLVPNEAKQEAEDLMKEIKSYEDMRFWHFVYLTDKDINAVFRSLKSSIKLDANLSTNAVFVIDKERNQRGRLDDRTKKEIEANKPKYALLEYDCIDVNILKNKLTAEDIRILFTEYRQKRKGKFKDSNTRRAEELKE